MLLTMHVDIILFPRFTNATFNRSTPRPDSVVPRISEPDQELNAVTIVRRGNTTGYDNPGFDSPWARARRGQKLSTLEWPESPNICSRDGIVCEGSSTPTKRHIKPLDTDSAYQEPSLAVNIPLSLYQLHLTSIVIFRLHLTRTSDISPLVTMMTKTILHSSQRTNRDCSKLISLLRASTFYSISKLHFSWSLGHEQKSFLQI